MGILYFKHLIMIFVISCTVYGENHGNEKIDGDVRANDLFRRYWDWQLRNAPEFATLIGVHKYDVMLDELSLSAYARRKIELKNWLSEVKKMASDSRIVESSPSTQMHLRVMQSELEGFLHGLQFATNLWPINIMEGPQVDFPNLVAAMKIHTFEDAMNVLRRMHSFPQQIQETIVLLREGMKLGRTMHSVSIDRVPKVLTHMATQPVNESRIFKIFLKKPEGLSQLDWYVCTLGARLTIGKYVQPSYQKLSDFIKDHYLKHTRPQIGVSSLPNGENYYTACLKFHTTLDITPDVVHAIGHREVRRITQRMISVMEETMFNGSLAQFRKHMATSEKFSFKTGEETLKHYKAIIRRVSKVLPRFFEALPKSKFIIVPMPADIAKTFTGVYYDAPAADGSRPGKVNINLLRPRDMKKYDAVALTLHESMPGHHLQIASSMESQTLPDFIKFYDPRRKYEVPAHFITSTAYLEGWGLYAEYLGEEMGMYANPYELYGRLSQEMLRAVRLVVDTGIHALGWSREKAIAFMMRHVASTLKNSKSEIDRYISWPGQACAYKIGELKIRELRTKAEKELGAKFDIRKFHKAVISTGTVPLNVLEEAIVQYINENK